MEMDQLNKQEQKHIKIAVNFAEIIQNVLHGIGILIAQIVILKIIKIVNQIIQKDGLEL